MPVTWLVAANDSYFSPDLSRKLADAFRSGGAKIDFHVLAASGGDLAVEWREADGHVLMTGPAAYEHDGRFDAALLADAGAA